MTVRLPKDRDFVETSEGFFFCVVGYLHPPRRYTAYLKYTPAATGRWARGGLRYHRALPYYHVQNVRTTLEFLERHHPRYVWFDAIRSLKFSFVPQEAVVTYYWPEERVAQIVRQPADPLEEDVRSLVTQLTATSPVRPDAFGITGSILLRLHDPAFSDIDLLVYGAENALKVRKAVEALRGGPIRELPPERRTQWRTETAERFGLGAEDLLRLESRRWNYFLFRDRYVSVHPTRSDVEITEAWGDRRWRPVGVATIEATVADATESLFLPACYRLADVSLVDGEPSSVVELISFEALYCQIADPGDRIRARGVVEQGEDGSGRLVVGAASLDDGGFLTVGPRRRG